MYIFFFKQVCKIFCLCLSLDVITCTMSLRTIVFTTAFRYWKFSGCLIYKIFLQIGLQKFLFVLECECNYLYFKIHLTSRHEIVYILFLLARSWMPRWTTMFIPALRCRESSGYPRFVFTRLDFFKMLSNLAKTCRELNVTPVCDYKSKIVELYFIFGSVLLNALVNYFVYANFAVLSIRWILMFYINVFETDVKIWIILKATSVSALISPELLNWFWQLLFLIFFETQIKICVILSATSAYAYKSEIIELILTVIIVNIFEIR